MQGVCSFVYRVENRFVTCYIEEAFAQNCATQRESTDIPQSQRVQHPQRKRQ